MLEVGLQLAERAWKSQASDSLNFCLGCAHAEGVHALANEGALSRAAHVETGHYARHSRSHRKGVGVVRRYPPVIPR
jgi:hypothetical protein